MMRQNTSRRYLSIVICVILAVVLAVFFASCKNGPSKDEITSSTTGSDVGETTDVGDATTDDTEKMTGGDSSGGTTSDESDETTGDETTEDQTTGGQTTEEETTEAHEHDYGEGRVTLDPTCESEGEKLYVCTVCGDEKIEKLPKLEHEMGEWEQVTAPTVNTEGLERRECKNCDHFEERATEKLPAVWHITVNDGMGNEIKVPVAADGIYALIEPQKIGYNFVGWKDADGNDFSASGTIDRDVTVTAIWEIDATETLDELIERAAAGVDLILIANDIVIDRPIYVPSTTKIYSLTPVKLIRDAGYTGDLFVIGQNADGENSYILNLVPVLTLGDESYEGDEVLLTIDGNRDGMNEGLEVSGTALFLINGARVNMYNGVSISNHQKTQNERVIAVNRYQFGNNTTSGGPVAMIASGSAFYMYGGIMDNNSARVTALVYEDGTSANLSGYGGAIFNAGTFNMYGGIISNCTANRGGAIYSDSIVNIVGGVIEGNYAKNKGGAICSSGSDASDVFIGTKGAEIGTVVFRNNSAGSQGGAILSYQDSPLIIFGGVLFEGNAALGSNGGAISTSGPITSYNNSFVGNTAKYSGGAIYQSYVSADHIIHIVELQDTLFEGNTANKGGAVTLTSSADAEKGAYAKIYNCRFVENGALHYASVRVDSETGEEKTIINGGNGGAIYSSQRSVFDIKNCEFIGNVAENLGGGAIGATVSSTITIKDSLFTDNRSIDVNGEENGRSGVGGAIYAYNGTSLTVSNTVFNSNSAYKNGGALYISSNTVNLTNIEFHSNSAGLNGGAIAQYDSSTLNISGIIATGNSAESTGGVIYNSRSTLNVTSNAETENIFGVLGATDEESEALANTATNGGAICGGNTSILNIDGAIFENNAAIPGVVETRDETTGEVIKTTYVDGYGGGIYATHGTQVNISNAKFASNSAKYGGAITLVKAATKLVATDSEFDSNSSTNCGGVLYVLSATADFENVIYNNNTSSKGGALYLSTKSTTNVKNSSFTGNTGTYGGAVYASNAQATTFEDVKFESNGISELKQTKTGGAIYIVGTTVDVLNCAFDGNHASASGGAIFLSGTETSTDSEGVETKSRAAAIKLDSSDFIGNDAKTGGAIYASVDSVISLNSLTFRDNRANATEADYDARGGAIYMLAANLEVNDVDFINNHADYYGGAIDAHTNSKATLNRVRFIDNSAINNGGALWLYTNTEFNITGVYASGNTSKSSGGFAYTRGVLNILADAEFGNVIKGVEMIAEQSDDPAEQESFKNAKNGGAIYCGVSSTVSAFDVNFTNNTAKNGGAIYSTGSAPVFEGCSFSDNSATYGGAVYVDGQTAVSECAFDRNSASYRGGAIYIVNEDELSENFKVVIKDSDFTANKAIEGGDDTARRGGAIYVAEYVRVLVSDSVFVENEATQYGGAVDVARGSVLNVIDSDFSENKAGSNGGAIWLYAGSTLSLSGGMLENNAATNEGGAIYSYNEVDIIGATFYNNTAEFGGAVFAAGGTTTTSGCTFVGNSAANGGSVYVRETASYKDGVDDTDPSVFTANTATNGGAIYLAAVEDPEKNPDRLAGQATLENTVFKENTASLNGGSIYITSGTDLTVNETSFEENSANRGGAVYLSGGTATLTDSEFIANDAVSGTNTARGGAMFAQSGTIKAIGVSFRENTAVSNAGAVVLNSAKAKAYFESVEFVDNVSGANGGALWLYGNATAEITGVIAKGNKAESGYGGFAYLTEGTLNVLSGEDVVNTFGGETEGEENIAKNGGALAGAGVINVSGASFIGNKATSNGGAIQTSGGGNIDDCTFIGNTAANGGAIYTSEIISLSECVFTSNSTKDCGGAIYVGENGKLYDGIDVTEGETVIEKAGSRFENNTAHYGGAIYLAKVEDPEKTPEKTAGYAKLDGTAISGNVANLYGGAFYIGSDAQLEAGGVAFEDNKAIRGGAGYVSGGQADIIDSEFNRNIAATVEGNDTDARAGAIFIASGVLNGEKVKFQHNTAGLNGGAIVTNSGSGSKIAEAYLTDVEFIGNVAQGLNGGAVWMNTDSIVEITGIVAKGNKAENGAGGVFYVTRSTLNILSAEGVFNVFGGDAEGDENVAESGGSIAGVSSSKINVDGASFIGNDATEGGAIYVTSAANISNSAFDGNSASYGGAVYVTGVLDLDGCIFNNNSTKYYGGAICVGENGKLYDGVDVTDVETVVEKAGSHFESNTASHGGSIYLAKVEDPEATPDSVAGFAKLDGTEFVGNVVTNSGGAICASTGANLTLNETDFTSNEADSGGAIYLSATATINDSNSIFKGNMAATGEGGAISSNGDVTLSGTTFLENKAESTGKRGGAIYLTRGTISATNVVFEGNTAAGNGGAIVLTGAAESIFNGCVFTDNASGNRAGAIYLTNSGLMTTLSCEFNENSAAGLGGAIYITTSGSYVDGDSEEEGSGSKFVGNTATGAGAIYADKVAELNGTVFESNSAIASEEGAEANGGALTAGAYGTVIVNGAEFTDNSAISGGAIYFAKGSHSSVINECVFIGNSVSYRGGAVYIANESETSSENKVVFSDSIFDSNMAIEGGEDTARRGGAIYVAEYVTVGVNNCSFEGNEATQYGGAIDVARGSVLDVTDSIFNTNKAGVNGGAIWMYAGTTLTATGCEFIDNETKTNGGAIYSYNTVDVSDSVFTNNSANQGGAVYTSGTATITDCGFTSNSAKENGGAIFTSGILNTSACAFTENSAICGGSIYASGVATTTGCTFTENTADLGGAIYTIGTTTTADCTFTSNLASDNGGAIYVADGTYTDGISDSADNGSTFTSNVATNGGAMYVVAGSANTYGSVFKENSVKTEITESTDEESGAITTAKTYLGNGGAICVAGDASYNGENTTFEGNIASLGGAIYTVGGTINSTDSTFIENAAITTETAVTTTETTETTVTYGKGGAVHVAENGIFNYTATEKLTFTDGVANDYVGPKFDGNLAANGAAIYIAAAETEGASAGTATVIGATIVNHNTIGNGGAIFANGALNTEGSIIYMNSTQGNGGAIYANKPYTDNGSLFVENTANGEGGAIRAGNSVTIENTQFIRNKSTSNRAGALLITSGSLNAKNVTFEYNDAYKAGGAVVLTGAKASVFEECIFNNNIDRTYRGGAIYMHNSELVTTLSCTFTGNSGKYGGAIYGTGSATYTDGSADSNSGSTFTENTSQTAGGAIYILGECHLYGTGFNNNTATTNGGAIYTSTTNTISNATFNGNNADLGGAIYVAGGATSTKDCTFSGNTATTGGAVYVAKGTYTDGISDSADNGSTFTSNVAINGGAMYVATGSANTYGSVFKENSVKTETTESMDEESGAITTVKTYLGNGGAICVAGGASYNGANTTFESNTAALGGAIYVIGTTRTETDDSVTNIFSTVVTVGCNFLSNNAIEKETTVTSGETAETTVTYSNGGAVYVDENGIFADGEDDNDSVSTFTSNNAKYGGAVYLAAVTNSGCEAGKATLENTKFAENTATTYGGAIHLASGSVLTANETSFEKNSANRGGAVYISGGTATFTNSEFVANSAVSGTNTARGGAMFAQSGTIYATNVSFRENTAVSNAGAVVLNSAKAKAYMETVDFIDNVSGGNGGALWLYDGATAEITGMIAKGNKAESGYGGFAYLTSGTLNVLSGEGVVNTIGGELEGEENIAKHGGAICGAGTINVSGASFIGNKATSNGGAIYTSGGANVDGCIFVGNTATNGGAVYATSDVTIENSTFEGNNSSTNGGAIYASGGATVDGCTFIGNNATNGGAIYTTGNLTVEIATFESNTASENGAAIYVNGNATTTKGCTFTENTATGNGGAVYVAKGTYIDGEAVLEGDTLTDAQNGSSFTSNTATNGGAICVDITASDATAGAVKLYGSTFTSNIASVNGGALANIGANAEIYYSSFDSNVAESKGGAIMSTSFDYDVNGTTYRIPSTLTMVGGEVKNSTVDTTWSSNGSYGGGLAVFYGSQATLDGVVFDNNKGYSGGAITSYGSGKVLNGEETVTVYTNVILNNVAVKNNDGQNGAIYVGGAGQMTVNGLIATDNTTKGSGAVIYLTSANSVLTVNSATLSGNKSGATHNDLTTGSLGFIQTANSANTLNIYKAGVTGADVNDNWDVLIKKGAKSTVNELTAPTTEQ